MLPVNDGNLLIGVCVKCEVRVCEGFMLFYAINAFNARKTHQRSIYSLGTVVQHSSGFGPDLAVVISALVLVVWCVVTVV